jgi:hypothetical protein
VRTRRRWTIAVPVVCCAIAVFTVSVAAQSLAEVARAEAERRKRIAQPSRVYTNKDLKPIASFGAPAPAEAEQTSPVAPPGGSREKRGASRPAAERHANGVTGEEPHEEEEDNETAKDEEKHRTEEEQRWRARMAAAHDQLERSRLFAEALQSRINALNADFSARDDPAQRAALGTQLNKALAELERVHADIEAQEKAVSDLEEEARRSGVPPGWFR